MVGGVCAELTRKHSLRLKLSYMFYCLNTSKITGIVSTEVTLVDHQRNSAGISS